MEITTTVRNSIRHLQHPVLTIPCSRGIPFFPPSTSAWELSTFASVCPSLPHCTNKQPPFSLHRLLVPAPPLFFFCFCTMSRGRKVITDQGKGHVCCLHPSFVQVSTQPSEKRKAGHYRAKGHRRLALRLEIGSKSFATLHHLLSHIETALTFSP